MKSHGIHVYGIFAQQRKQMSQHFKIEKATSSNIPSFECFFGNLFIYHDAFACFFLFTPNTTPQPIFPTQHATHTWPLENTASAMGPRLRRSDATSAVAGEGSQGSTFGIFFMPPRVTGTVDFFSLSKRGVQLTQIEKRGKTYVKICERRTCGNTTSTKTASLPLKIDVLDRWFSSLLVQPRPIFRGENVGATARVSMYFHENRCGNVYHIYVWVWSSGYMGPSMHLNEGTRPNHIGFSLKLTSPVSGRISKYRCIP